MTKKTNGFLLSFLVGLLLLSHLAYGQQFKSYKTDKFSIEYPISWQVTNEKGIINFFPKENYGALTFSFLPNIGFPLEKTRDFILEIHNSKDNPENVKMITKREITEFYYEHRDQNVKWATKAFRKNNEFFLLTINCEESKWEAEKHIFLKVMNSFKIK